MPGRCRSTAVVNWRVGVAEDADGRIVCLEPGQVAVDVGVVEVVNKDDDGQVDVRTGVGTVAVIFPDAGGEPELVGVGRERVSVEEADVAFVFS